MRPVLVSLVVLVLLFPIVASGATYIVGDDRALIVASQAIVTGTVLDTYARAGENGRIETVTEVLVEESLKGDVARTVRVVHPGGRLGDRWMIATGAPQYARGERVLLFLDRRNSDFTTHARSLGSFRFERELLVRGDIAGWDEDGTPHVERPRREREFLEFIRATVRGETRALDEAPFANAANDIQPNAAFTSGSYTLRFDESATTPIRRFGNDLAVSWRISGTQGGLDFVEALDFAVAKWNAQSSLLDFTRGAPATGDTLARDGESRVIAGDPHGEVPGSCCYGGSIIAAAFVEGPADATTPFNGEPFFRITSADVIINDGVSVANFGQGRFNTTMAHELGHTLGLRHSDEGLHGGPCLGAIECCSGSSCFAIMRAAVTTSLLALQSWDKNAIDCLYDAECRQTSSCVPPAIATQPQNRTITPGGTTSLSVSVSGTLPFTYQWYAGFAGDTSQPIGGNSATLSGVSPLVTSQYWVRVSGSCGAAVNSRTAIVTVCRPPSISVQPEETKQVKAGERVTLSVAASGDAALTYAWFEGESGDTSTPLAVTSADFTSAPLTHETKFWVRVTNGCGSVNSATTTVRIVPARRRAVR